MILLAIPLVIAAFFFVSERIESRLDRRAKRFLDRWAASMECRITDYHPDAEWVRSRDLTYLVYHAFVTDQRGYQFHAVVVFRSFLGIQRLIDVTWIEPNHERHSSKLGHRVEFDEYFDRI